MSISLIAAISKNYVIGKNNDLPWHIPEDLKHFRDVTRGKTVLMGRKTWESIPEKFRPLPKRVNIVVTRNKEYQVPESVVLFNNIEEALASRSNEEVMVIGGGGIYAQTIKKADMLYITHVDMEVEGDVLFPQIDLSVWKETEREDHDGFSFVTYKRQS